MNKAERDARMCQLMDGREAVDTIGGYRLCQHHVELVHAIAQDRPDRCGHREATGRCAEGTARRSSDNVCPKYCGAHCKAHRDDHDCPRGRKRDYMRHFMRKRYHESRERTRQLNVEHCHKTSGYCGGAEPLNRQSCA